MKYVWKAIRLLLPVAGIVLLALWAVQGAGAPLAADSSKLLGAGLLCTSLSSCLNLYFSRKNRKQEK